MGRFPQIKKSLLADLYTLHIVKQIIYLTLQISVLFCVYFDVLYTEIEGWLLDKEFTLCHCHQLILHPL